jgi:hypothetical protein
MSVRQFHLPIYKFRHACFQAARAGPVARNETTDCGVYEAPLDGSEKCRRIIHRGRCCLGYCAVRGCGSQDHQGRSRARTEEQIASIDVRSFFHFENRKYGQRHYVDVQVRHDLKRSGGRDPLHGSRARPHYVFCALNLGLSMGTYAIRARLSEIRRELRRRNGARIAGEPPDENTKVHDHGGLRAACVNP